MPLWSCWSPQFFLMLLLLWDHGRLCEHLPLIDLYIQRFIVFLYSFNNCWALRPQTFGRLFLRSTLFLVLAQKTFHVVLKVLVFEICDTLPPFRTLKSCGLGLRTSTRCYRLGKAAEALCVEGLLLLLRSSCEVINNAVKLSAHLSGILIIVVFVLLFLVDLIMLFGEMLTLIVLEVISGILGVTFLLMILLIKGHLVDLII